METFSFPTSPTGIQDNQCCSTRKYRLFTVLATVQSAVVAYDSLKRTASDKSRTWYYLCSINANANTAHGRAAEHFPTLPTSAAYSYGNTGPLINDLTLRLNHLMVIVSH